MLNKIREKTARGLIVVALFAAHSLDEVEGLRAKREVIIVPRFRLARERGVAGAKRLFRTLDESLEALQDVIVSRVHVPRASRSESEELYRYPLSV